MISIGLRTRRRALGLRVSDVAHAAGVQNWQVVDPSVEAAILIDAALKIIETGGSLEAARAASMNVPRENVQRNRVDWPEHSGGVERLSGQCFKDVATTDGGGRLPLLRGSSLGSV